MTTFNDIFAAVNLTGPAADLRLVCLGALMLGLLLAGGFMIARVIGIRLGGLDDD